MPYLYTQSKNLVDIYSRTQLPCPTPTQHNTLLSTLQLMVGCQRHSGLLYAVYYLYVHGILLFKKHSLVGLVCGTLVSWTRYRIVNADTLTLTLPLMLSSSIMLSMLYYDVYYMLSYAMPCHTMLYIIDTIYCVQADQ